MLACYTDRLSVRPGERFSLHATADAGPCHLSVTRIGAQHLTVLERDQVQVGHHPTPAHADRDGCGWPVALEVDVGLDWASGYYDIVLTDANGAQAHHFVVVKPPVGVRRASALLVLSTNTYQSYNYWGGANTYANVSGLMSGQVPFAQAMDEAIGILSTQRPFPPLIVAPPADAPRLMNLRTQARLPGGALGRRHGLDGRAWRLPL